MSTQKARKYLDKIPLLNLRLKALKGQVLCLNDMATDISPTITGMPRVATPNVHRLDGIIAAKLDLENEAQGTAAELLSIHANINRLSDMSRAIISERYVCGKSWSDIATELNFSESNLYRLHNAALAELETILTAMATATKKTETA